jgi:hypothetical protein
MDQLTTKVSVHEHVVAMLYSHPSSPHLVLELMQWRAMIEGFKELITVLPNVGQHPFFKYWWAGSNYGVTTLLSKLASNDLEEHASLLKLWAHANGFLVEDKIITGDEYLEINRRMMAFQKLPIVIPFLLQHGSNLATFTEPTDTFVWEEFDTELALLARIWSLLIQWSGNIPLSLTSDTELTKGLDQFLNRELVTHLQHGIEHYLHDFESWCTTSIATNERCDYTPFAFIEGKAEVLQ